MSVCQWTHHHQLLGLIAGESVGLHRPWPTCAAENNLPKYYWKVSGAQCCSLLVSGGAATWAVPEQRIQYHRWPAGGRHRDATPYLKVYTREWDTCNFFLEYYLNTSNTWRVFVSSAHQTKLTLRNVLPHASKGFNMIYAKMVVQLPVRVNTQERFIL